MNDKRIIEDVLKELYAVDPALREQEEGLIKAVRAMLAAKPDARVDRRFVGELRAELLEKFSAAHATSARMNLTFYERFMKNDSLKFLVPSGIAAALVLAVMISTQGPKAPDGAPLASVSPEAAKPAAGVRVTKVADGSFGTLTSGGGAEQSGMAAGRGGGGGGNPSAMPVADAKMMPPYQPTYYAYSFAGDLSLTDEKASVYKRRKGTAVSPVGSGLLDSAALGLVDASRLGSLGLQSLSLVQDKEFGYYVYVDMNEGMISLSQNYAKWPHPEQECRDEECYARYRLRESDMITDDEAFAIADGFLKELGVNVGSYSAPVMSYDWRAQYAALKPEDRAAYYFPEIVSVTYPLVVDGQKVYDEAGNPTGLTVNVNVRHKRADGLWNLSTLDFDSALYDAVTDVEKVRAAVSRGGVYEGVPPTDAKTENVDLGAPERVLMRAWSGGQEVIVPALRFAVLKKPADQPWFRDTVMIPLVKDLFDVQTPNPILMVK